MRIFCGSLRITGLVFLIVLTALYTANCGKGDGSGAIVKGYACQGSSVIIVDDPANAPAGHVSVVGAVVYVGDIAGSEVGTGTSGPDAGFQIEDLPIGFLTVEVLLDPESLAVDASMPFTSFPDTTIVLGKNYSVTREQATALVLADTPEISTVLGTLQPLPPGVVVQQQTSDGLFNITDQIETEEKSTEIVRRVKTDEWFFFVNIEHNNLYAHDVEYVFVDAGSGEVTRIVDLLWPPEINGADVWGSDFDCIVYQGIDFDNFDPDNLPESLSATPTIEVVQQPVSQEFYGQPFGNLLGFSTLNSSTDNIFANKHNTDPESIFTLYIRGAKSTTFIVDYLRMRRFFSLGGIPMKNQAYVRTPEGPMKTVGSDLSKKYWDIQNEIIKRLDQKPQLHSTLIVYLGAHGDALELRPGDKNIVAGTGKLLLEFKDGKELLLSPEALFEVFLKHTKACRLRVFVVACYSKSFATKLNDLFVALPKDERPETVIYYSSDLNETSEGRTLANAVSVAPGAEDLLQAGRCGTFFNMAVFDTGKIANGDLEGLLADSGTIAGDSQLKKPAFGEKNQAERHPGAFVVSGDPDWCKEGISTEIMEGFVASLSGDFEHISAFESVVYVWGTVHFDLVSAATQFVQSQLLPDASVTLEMTGPKNETMDVLTDENGDFAASFSINQFGTYTINVVDIIGTDVEYNEAKNAQSSVIVHVQ